MSIVAFKFCFSLQLFQMQTLVVMYSEARHFDARDCFQVFEHLHLK